MVSTQSASGVVSGLQLGWKMTVSAIYVRHSVHETQLKSDPLLLQNVARFFSIITPYKLDHAFTEM